MLFTLSISRNCTISFPGRSTGNPGREIKHGPQHVPQHDRQHGTGRPQASVHPNLRQGNHDHDNYHDDHPLMNQGMSREGIAG